MQVVNEVFTISSNWVWWWEGKQEGGKVEGSLDYLARTSGKTKLRPRSVPTSKVLASQA